MLLLKGMVSFKTLLRKQGLRQSLVIVMLPWMRSEKHCTR